MASISHENEDEKLPLGSIAPGPINTKYNGYNFRSRLEARWAVYFDLLMELMRHEPNNNTMQYEYEVEGYQLSNGMWYLPDFYFSNLKIFVEIKPDKPSDEEEVKCKTLAKDKGVPVVILYGSPWSARSMWWHLDECPDSAFLVEIFVNFILYSDIHLQEAAKSVRFEHGEVPIAKNMLKNILDTTGHVRR